MFNRARVRIVVVVAVVVMMLMMITQPRGTSFSFFYSGRARAEIPRGREEERTLLRDKDEEAVLRSFFSSRLVSVCVRVLLDSGKIFRLSKNPAALS